jgi:hypothetical protein
VKPAVHFFRTFGCVAHIKQGSKRLSKLEDHSTQTVFIGYEPGSKAWRFYDPVTKRVHVSRDAIFEDRAWDWSDQGNVDSEPFNMEFVSVGGVSRVENVCNQSSCSYTHARISSSRST